LGQCDLQLKVEDCGAIQSPLKEDYELTMAFVLAQSLRQEKVEDCGAIQSPLKGDYELTMAFVLAESPSGTLRLVAISETSPILNQSIDFI
jgi:hypothetical protein